MDKIVEELKELAKAMRSDKGPEWMVIKLAHYASHIEDICKKVQE